MININCKYKLKIAILFFTLISSGFIKAQDHNYNQALAKALVESGYENIKIFSDEKIVVIAYENRLFSFELNAIKNVIETIVPLINDREELILVPLNRKIPIVKIESTVQNFKQLVSNLFVSKELANNVKISVDVDDVFALVQNEKEYNSSNFKFDLVLKPQFNFEFGPYEKPVIAQINLLPELKAGFWKGNSLGYEVIVPVFNEYGDSGDSVRTGSVTFNQMFRMPNSIFVSLSSGVFTQNRYGIDVEAKKIFGNGIFSIGANLGYTSYIRFSSFSRILYSDVFKFTGSLNFDYRVAQYDLTLGLTVGKFLLDDNSIRVDINREFGQIEIGFFAIKSFDGLSNGGISVTIPLWPPKQFKPEIFRIRTAENYNFSYIVKSNSNDLIGLRYNTGNRIDRFLKKLNPSFIINSFTK